MANDSLHVYLDHLITRENLRYQRPRESFISSGPSDLRMSDLFSDDKSSRTSALRKLRKPDFQRTTWSWTPEDCVSLLDSIINDQVVPSIIMWASPENGYEYVLDGGHRISVVIAWLNDDWGQDLPPNEFREEREENAIKEAARQVRDLVKIKVGSIADFQLADEKFSQIVMEEKAPRVALDPQTFNRSLFYQRLERGDVTFKVLWVKGSYEIAEQSFLKINKGGSPLTPWEATIIENRHSSFMRTVMSLTSISSANHYWHSKDLEKDPIEGTNKKADEILVSINELYNILFNPVYETPIRRLQQPLFVAPEAQIKPRWLSQLLAIVERGKGVSEEIKILVEKDKKASPEVIVDNGLNLVNKTLNAFSHLVGTSPKSLSVIPALYFYSSSGRYVRSLLFGLLHWLLSGTDEQVLDRKRVLSVHRATFEQILLDNKEDVVTGITRKTGSGPEVTGQTAQYFQGLLELLVKHKDDIASHDFNADYGVLTKKLTNRASKARISSGKSRSFTSGQKSTLVLDNFFSNPNRCGICGGMLDPSASLQHDHIVEYAKGGKTLPENQRLVHPFCNNPANRAIIEAGRNGRETVRLPRFISVEFGATIQPELFGDSDFL